jgi:mono/diheme cytochrome c family protein
MKRSNYLLIAVLISVMALGIAFASRKNLDGRRLFQSKNCVRCHSVSSANIEARFSRGKLAGGDLTGAVKNSNSKRVTRFLRKKARIGGKLHPTSFKGTDEELQALVDWLLEQK